MKTIVITGATRGIGRALAERCVELGLAVIGCGRSESQIESLRSKFSPPHCFDALDVTDAGAVNTWANSVLKQIGAPDYLINNAGLVNENAPLWEISAEEFSRIIDTNIKGVANVIRAFAPSMVKVKRGVIVNLSSGWGRSVSPEVAPYCASKWAIEGLSKSLAEEVPQGICVVPLNPGIINTDMLRTSFGTGAANYPSAKEWAERAAPFILKLTAAQNGKSLSVPGM